VSEKASARIGDFLGVWAGKDGLEGLIFGSGSGEKGHFLRPGEVI
jgi:hypothetical protein